MSKTKKFLLSAASLSLLATAAQANHPDATYVAELNSLNNSGVTGTATVAIRGDLLTVVIAATGLTADQPHAQHIHGQSDKTVNAFCPDISVDTDGDNLVTIPEGAGSYGGVLISLGDDAGASPVVDASGNLAYSQTFTLGANGNIATPDLLPLENRAVVLHGLSVMGTYDGALPAACGELVEQ